MDKKKYITPDIVVYSLGDELMNTFNGTVSQAKVKVMDKDGIKLDEIKLDNTSNYQKKWDADLEID